MVVICMAITCYWLISQYVFPNLKFYHKSHRQQRKLYRIHILSLKVNYYNSIKHNATVNGIQLACNTFIMLWCRWKDIFVLHWGYENTWDKKRSGNTGLDDIKMKRWDVYSISVSGRACGCWCFVPASSEISSERLPKNQRQSKTSFHDGSQNN